MNILFVIDYYGHPGGGTEGQLLGLIRGLSGLGERPQLAVFRATEFTQDPANRICPLTTLRIDRMLSFKTVARMIGLARFLRRERIDLVHVFFNDAALVVPLFARLAGCKVVVSRRDLGLWYSPGKLRLLRFVNRFVDRIVANSRAVADHVRRHEGGPPPPLLVIHNGYQRARLALPAQADLREKPGIGAEDPIIGMVANLRPVKRPADAVRAFAQAHRSHPSAHLIFLGEGPMQDELQALADSLGCGRSVHFLGSLKEVIPVVKQFRAGLLCSESEGFSNALIEYMACGVPPVCTNVGGNAELVQDGVTGYLVDLGDIDALARRMSSLIADPELSQRIGSNARRSVERLSMDEMVASHLAVYRELLSNGRTPS